MKITIFTSNQPRHMGLISRLSQVASEVFAIQECTTIFPGEVEDFYKKTDVMKEYFSRVTAVENDIFGAAGFSPDRVRTLPLRMGDLNKTGIKMLEPALHSDYYIVFGASYIKGELCDFLVQQGALNIHMGVSPFFRGTSCNFWALQSGNLDYVGATIHLLTKGLDSGPMLFHTLPKADAVDGFTLTMRAVKVAHEGLARAIEGGTLKKMAAVPQDRSQEIKYTKKTEFTDEIAALFLKNQPTPAQIQDTISRRDLSRFLLPYVG